MLIDAVAVVRARLLQLAYESRAAAEAAQEAGTSQGWALCANALERARVTSILPHLPDNDWIRDQVRVRGGLPSLLECSLADRP